MPAVGALITALIVLSAFPGSVLSLTPAERAQALLAKMALADKVSMLHGVNSPGYTGSTAPNQALGIPALTLNDGRQGFRPNDQSPTETAFPCQLAAVSTFDIDLMNRFGAAMGQEFAGKGANVVLAPMLILARVPEDGRTFESIGEDPELAFAMARAHVEGVQSVPGVIANADDFVLNNQVSDS
jgi:beta-glucosidase